MSKNTPIPLPQSFFQRPALQVAEDLPGKFLVTPSDALMITEVEVYDGFEDRASHAFKGRTARNSVMFGPGGFWYVYFVYGMYWMLNIVTGAEDYPSAILIRGAGTFNGPGKLTRELGIDKSFYGLAATPKNGLWIEDRGVRLAGGLQKTPRIGVKYAGEEWAAKKWRFVFT